METETTGSNGCFERQHWFKRRAFGVLSGIYSAGNRNGKLPMNRIKKNISEILTHFNPASIEVGEICFRD
jgi:hypothetical protein